MISTEQIKELREKTGAGIADIKKALEESGGDISKALGAIESRLGGVAAKKAGRETKAGLVESYIHGNGKIGVLIELLCETDFVARTFDFKNLAHELSMQIAAVAPQDAEALLAAPFIKDQNKTVKDVLNEAVGKFGENIQIGKFSRIEL